MSSVKQATTLVVDSFSGNSLVYLKVLFRLKFPLVSVIVVVGLQKNVRQRTPPSELILFWSNMTSVFQGLSLSRSVRWIRENPGNEVVGYTYRLRRHPVT